MNPTVLCIGGVNLDSKLKLAEPLRMGTSNPVSSRISSGGVARNVAENLARLESRVFLLGVFGDDPEGNRLRGELQKLKIDCSCSLVVSEKRSGSYTAIEDPEGEMLLALADMELADSMPVDHFEKNWKTLPRPDAVFLDTNFSEPVLEWVIERCKKENLPLHVDPVSIAKSNKLPGQLSGVDTLQPNLGELESLSGKSLTSDDEQASACRILLERGVKNVVLSLGSGGLNCINGESRIRIETNPVQTFDVTGAGDALSAGVLWGRLQRWSMEQACRTGMLMAEKALQCKHSVWPELKREKLLKLLNRDTKDAS